MFKRISGAAVAVLGLVIVIIASGRLAYAIPANFTTNGTGVDMLVDLAERYALRGHIVSILAGLALCLSALPLLLSPRKRRVAVVVPSAEPIAAMADGDAPIPQPEAFALQPAAPIEGELVSNETVSRILRAKLMGSTFRNPDGVSRRTLLAGIAAGDILLCRTEETGSVGEIIGVYTLRGECLGFLDSGFVRDLRARYPGFRIGITVERVLGGELPHSCLLRVAVYGDVT